MDSQGFKSPLPPAPTSRTSATAFDAEYANGGSADGTTDDDTEVPASLRKLRELAELGVSSSREVSPVRGGELNQASRYNAGSGTSEGKEPAGSGSSPGASQSSPGSAFGLDGGLAFRQQSPSQGLATAGQEESGQPSDAAIYVASPSW